MTVPFLLIVHLQTFTTYNTHGVSMFVLQQSPLAKSLSLNPKTMKNVEMLIFVDTCLHALLTDWGGLYSREIVWLFSSFKQVFLNVLLDHISTITSQIFIVEYFHMRTIFSNYGNFFKRFQSHCRLCLSALICHQLEQYIIHISLHRIFKQYIAESCAGRNQVLLLWPLEK